jgi:hypothetical protein
MNDMWEEIRTAINSVQTPCTVKDLTGAIVERLGNVALETSELLRSRAPAGYVVVVLTDDDGIINAGFDCTIVDDDRLIDLRLDSVTFW